MVNNKIIYRIGLLGMGGKLTIEDGFLRYQNPYAHTFRVPLRDISTVAVDDVGWGKAMLKVIGNGVELAKAKMPLTWANECQDWILKNKE